jgi:hypothetical protein
MVWMRRLTDITPAEWRWVSIVSALLVALTLAPYAMALALDQSTGAWRFMGILPNPQDGATYLAKIAEGQRGAWLFTLAHTPEVTSGSAIQLFYVMLGQFSRVAGFSALLTFHLARVATSFTMYLAIYYLGAAVWQKLRARRLFFGIVGVGSGLGWLALVLLPTLQPVDLFVPEAIPLYAGYANPHFPVAIALLALLTAQFILVFRPGFEAMPGRMNGGLVVLICSILLALIQPQAWVPIAAALPTYLALQFVRTGQAPRRFEMAWTGLYIVPALPVLFYDLALVAVDPLYKVWNQQNQTPSGSPLNYAIGFGLLWALATPGIIRAARLFERDGDRFMLIWLIVNILLLYAPFSLQRRLVIGLILPLGYFCVRSLEDYWLPRMRKPRRPLYLIALFTLILPSNVLALVIPLTGVLNTQAGLEARILLTGDYAASVDWLRTNAGAGSVVLALPEVSLWVPAYTSARVVYGHPFETVDAAAKRDFVRAFYSGDSCQLSAQPFPITYVIIGPNAVPDAKENLTPDPQNTPCKRALGNPIAAFGAVSIYDAKPALAAAH